MFETLINFMLLFNRIL